MKSFILVLTFLFSLSALAEIRVGDMLVYTAKDKAGKRVGELSVKITSYDSKEEDFKMVVKSSVPGERPHYEEDIEHNEYPSRAEIRQLVRFCRKAGGTPKIEKVPAGIFRTCVKKKSSTRFWSYADVPVVGVIKFNQRNNQNEDFFYELKFYKRGLPTWWE